METIKIKGSDYQKIDTDQAIKFSHIYGYWQLKDPDFITITDSTKSESLEESLGDFQDFGLLLVHFGESKASRLNQKKCVVVFDNAALKGIEKEAKQQNQNNNNGSQNPRPNNGKTLAEIEALSNSKLELIRMELDSKLQLKSQEAAIENEKLKLRYETDILNQKLEREYERLKADLEKSEERRNAEFERKEIEFERKEAELNLKVRRLQRKLAQYLEDKEVLDTDKEESKKMFKTATEAVSEGVVSGVLSGIANTAMGFFGKQALNGLSNNFENHAQEQQPEAPQEQPNPKEKKSSFSFENIEEVEEGEEAQA